jgi:predicted nuclease of restriction endonuclease-like (RecB) superfamily
MPHTKDELNPVENTVYNNIRTVLVTARQKVYSAINFAMVEAYWEVGRQIEQAVGDRAEYGKGLLQDISQKLSVEFGKGFTVRNLQAMRQFYTVFPNTHALRAELSWTHYRLLMKVNEPSRREFYLKECAESNWSSRQLERQINSFFYERLLATQKSGKESVKNEIYTTEPKTDPDYILKDPYILEFLDLKENKNYHENELEQALIDNLQQFLLELGKGFSFVARQKRITLEGDHYYIDLVFYNYILKCFIVIDLKTKKLTYQDIGQIDCMRRVRSTLRQIPYLNNHTPSALRWGWLIFTSAILTTRLSRQRITQPWELFYAPKKMTLWQSIRYCPTKTIC